jgi:hypothetical protein
MLAVTNRIEVRRAMFDSQLVLTCCFQQCSANTHGFIQIAARIEHIMGILSETPNQGLLDELHESVTPRVKYYCDLSVLRELRSIMADLEVASSLGKLDQFFNTTQNASCIAKHNARLTQIICTTAVRVDLVVILPYLFDSIDDQHVRDSQKYSRP